MTLVDSDVCGLQIKMGVPLDIALSGANENGDRKRGVVLERLISTSKSFLVIPKGSEINIVLHENIQPRDILEAFCRAIFLGVAITAKSNPQKLSTVQKSLSSILKSDVFVRIIYFKMHVKYTSCI